MALMNRFFILFVVAVQLFSVRPAQADEAAEKLILATYKLANESSTASGFAVHVAEGAPEAGAARQYIVTAHHVLEQMRGESCRLVSRKRGDDGVYQRDEIHVAIRAGGNPIWQFDKTNDVAVLPLPENLSIVSLPMQCLATESSMADVRTGDEILAAVFPERTEANNAGFPILRGGVIASYPLRPIDSHSKFLVDTNAWNGDSGGAVAHRNLRYQEDWPLIIGVVHGMQSVTENMKESRFVQRRIDYPLGISVVVHAALARRLLEK